MDLFEQKLIARSKELGMRIFKISKREQEMNITFFKFTPILQFLDIVELKISSSKVKSGVSLILGHSWSSSILPAWFPLSFCAGFISFWIPYYDFGFNLDHLLHLKNTLFPEASYSNKGIVEEREQSNGDTLEKVYVKEIINYHGSGSWIRNSSLIKATSSFLDLKTQFFIVYILVPSLSIFSLVLCSGVVKHQ